MPWYTLVPLLSLISCFIFVVYQLLSTSASYIGNPTEFSKQLCELSNSTVEGSSNHLKITQLVWIKAGGTSSGYLIPNLMLLKWFCLAHLLGPVQRAPVLWSFACLLQVKFVNSFSELARALVHLQYSMTLYFNDLNRTLFELLCGRNSVFPFLFVCFKISVSLVTTGVLGRFSVDMFWIIIKIWPWDSLKLCISFSVYGLTILNTMPGLNMILIKKKRNNNLKWPSW